ncbi:hypothetical protein B0H10DRAFT_2047084 [Mycena sp. CBHHK59/15]|nr:hypothetical protein B0H10DRAFT_2047084 [Mycena sp. CBHHK59/15]
MRASSPPTWRVSGVCAGSCPADSVIRCAPSIPWVCRARERWRRPDSAYAMPADLHSSARPNRPQSAGDSAAAALPRAVCSVARVHVVLCSHRRRRALADPNTASRKRCVDTGRASGASRVRPTLRHRTTSNSV